VEKKVNTEEFTGKYIATESFSSNKIIASGTDLVEVYNEAIESGVSEPVINFIPKEGIVSIY
jgi:hypothetical protein